MTYKWQGENWGRSLIKDAIAEGYTIAVWSGGDEADYRGKNFRSAWEAVKAVDDSVVVIHKVGARSERAVIVLDYDQNGDEVINDFTVGGWIEKWCDAKTAKQREGAS